jgi:GNAT superfamily N-acetyltransferase
MAHRLMFEARSLTDRAGDKVRPARRDQETACVGVLQVAFAADPPSRKIWPEDERFHAAFPRFVRAFAGRAFEIGTAYMHAGGAGVALWLPPGETPDEEALGRVLEETVAPDVRDAAFAVFERMGAYHPREAHWHLPLIGVDPSAQGRGIGVALLTHTLARCDAQGLPAYLEATSARSVPLYERHGFEALGRIQVAHFPPIVPMLRRPLPR